ncbi:MAG: alpha/beta hydrolase family protein, partial [Planctomycetia bacterium]
MTAETKNIDHSQPLFFHDGDRIQPVTGRTGWAKRRADVLRGMQEVMGPPPTKKEPLDFKIESTTQADGYLRHRASFAVDPGDRVPALLLVPDVLQKPAPGVLCLHQTNGALGKAEPAGLGGSPNLHYAHELAKRGFVALVPDYPSFGEYPYDFAKSPYASGSMKAIWNNIRAVDALAALPDVDVKRLGCIGHSLGGHNTMFTAVFEPRLVAMVSCCGFTAFGKYYGG